MFSKKIFDYIAKLILMLLMSFSFVYPFITTLLFKYTPLQITGVILFFLLLFSILFFNRMTTRISVIAIILGSSIFVGYTLFSGSIYRLTEPFVWLYRYINGTESIKEFFPLVFTLLFSFVFSLAVYIFTVKKFSFHIILLTGISIFCAQWIFNYFAQNAYISFYTFIISIVIYYLLHIYNKKSVQESNDFASLSSFIILAVPVALLVLFLTSVIPASQKPIEWKWLDEKINTAFSNRSNIFGSDYFSLSTTGFGSSSNKLGGNITPDDTLVFKVKAPNVIYLKGCSSDQYTGNSWVNTNISYSDLNDQNNKLNFDTYELEHGLPLLYDSHKTLESYTPDILHNIPIDKINISYENITTNSLFVPLKAYSFFPASYRSDMFVNPEGILLSRRSLGKGFNYSFQLYNIKYSDKDFQNLMKVSERYLYDSYLEHCLDKINKYIKTNVLNIVNDNGDNIWIDTNEQEIEQLILGAPDTELMKNQLTDYIAAHFNPSLNLSPEVKQTYMNTSNFINIIDSQNTYEQSFDPFEWVISLKSLSSNSNSIYSKYLSIPDTVPQRVKELAVSITQNEKNDYDKVKAIEQYLSKNYKYSLTPGDAPKNYDFVDYFLFEHKEGYCTYFATAMAILTRSIGIPSRYVEGYLLPYQPINNDLYEVTNKQAHAWVEVYFEGIGWLQFEPTASFGNNLYNTKENKSTGQTPQINANNRPINSSAPNHQKNIPQQTVTAKAINYKLIIIISTVLAVIIIIFLIVLFNIHRRKRILTNFAKLPPREGIIELYNYFMKYLTYQKADFKGGETPIEHAKRLDNIGRFFPNKMEEITKIFVNARYSPEEVTQSDFNKVLSFYQPVLKATRENLGIVRYTLFMYILFKL